MRATPTAHARNPVHWVDLTLAFIAATAALLGAGLGLESLGCPRDLALRVLDSLALALKVLGAVFEVLNKAQQAQCFAAEQRSFVQIWLLSVKVSQSNVVASPMDYRTYP